MPKIFEYFGLVFFVYTEDHLPIHVHVKYAEYENKFELLYDLGALEIKGRRVRSKKSLPSTQRKEAEQFIRAFDKSIVEKWNRIMVYHLPVDFEKITKKLK
ncbi:DUF4160 domain-containing protein [Persicitalea sp.]|uniref:DUF4160 domain-containing protein n=1 Tax=Persicitalea sp. TaxID=3100273 RepID=UPI003592FD19